MLIRYSLLLLVLWFSAKSYAQAIEQQTEVLFQSTIKITKRTDQQLTNLYKLCKVWGYLKYKHPDITSGKIDWDSSLFSYAALTHKADFEALLYEQLPTLEKHTRDTLSTFTPRWINRDSLFGKDIQDYFFSLSAFAMSEKQQYIQPGRWNITPNFLEKKYPQVSYEDDGMKLLALFRYWNIIEYFFPYKDLMDEDWDHVLKEYIPEVLATSTELEYKLVLLQLVCKINDGHGGIHNDKTLDQYLGQMQVPIEVKVIGEEACVNRLFDEDLPIKVGDRVLAINGKGIRELWDARSLYVPASTEAARKRILSEYILRTNDSISRVKVIRNQSELSLNIPTRKYNPLQYVQRDIPSHREISADIVYIYPGALKPGELELLLAKYKNKAAIIFDYRSYPSVNIQGILPSFLLPVPKFAFKSKQYSKKRLGEFHFSQAYKWGEINESYYKGKFVILVNEYTQSQPEFEILIYKQAPNVTIIGSSTAGAIGNWTPIYLPGNILTSISGNGIFRYDESPVQRIGIIPDIYVEPTVKGIETKKDEVLLEAIRFSEGN